MIPTFFRPLVTSDGFSFGWTPLKVENKAANGGNQLCEAAWTASETLEVFVPIPRPASVGAIKPAFGRGEFSRTGSLSRWLWSAWSIATRLLSSESRRKMCRASIPGGVWSRPSTPLRSASDLKGLSGNVLDKINGQIYTPKQIN